jgi:ABC-2 type transport system permease protein
MILIPLLIIGISLLPSMLINKGNDYPLPLGIVDFTKKYETEFSKELVSSLLANGQPAFFTFNLSGRNNDRKSVLNFADKQVLSSALIGYVIINDEPNLNLTFRSKDIFNLEKLSLIERSFNKSAIKIHAKEQNIDYTKSEILISKISRLNKSYIDAQSEDDILKSFLNSYLFIILLITLILFSGGMFVRSLILEKSNRIIELILSSCTSKELLLGKVLGLSFFGLFQLTVWMVIGIILHKTNTLDFTTIKNLEYQLLFFVLGYIFYSSVFIGLGSIVNVDQEAQQLTGIISIFLIFPIILAVEILRSPNSILSLVLSYFPLTSVPVMLLRLNSIRPGIIEIFTVIVILIFSTYVVIFISSKLFRFGILKTGKRADLKEIISWMKLK